MNAAVGIAGMVLALLAALGGTASLAVGLLRRRPRLRDAQVYSWLLLAGALVAALAMEHALITHDFRLAYVADNNSLQTPLIYSVTGLWSALQGSILLWILVLAGWIVAMVRRFKARGDDALVAWAGLVTFLVAVFFTALVLGPAFPFSHVVGRIPSDGAGPNPLLQDNILVAFHPVFLYMGYVGFTVPFAFAVASLATGRLGEGWLAETRRWTLIAWASLGFGILLGAWWSYQVLGWGGFWAWDPVENAALLPWLCGTAYLHSVMAQERRGLLRVWNLSLIVAAFSMTIFGTFLTRSGVIESVHSFTSSDIGPELLGFFALVAAVGIGLIAWRGELLRADAGIDSLVSREGSFLLNNLAFGAFAFVVLLGTVFPLVVQAVDGQQITVGRPYFDTFVGPIGMVLLFLMAVGPALTWRATSATVLWRRLALPAWAGGLVIAVCALAGVKGAMQLAAFGLAGFAAASSIRQLALSVRAAHRRGDGPWRGLIGRANGGMVVHLGVAILAVAVVASLSYGQRTQVTLRPGHSVTFDGHRITYLRSATVVTPASTANEVDIRVDGGTVFKPALTSFGSDTEPVGTPAIDSGFRDDVYLTINSDPSASGPVKIGIIVQPMVSWLWTGGFVMAIGTLAAMIPDRRRRRRPSARRSGSAAEVDQPTAVAAG